MSVNQHSESALSIISRKAPHKAKSRLMIETASIKHINYQSGSIAFLGHTEAQAPHESQRSGSIEYEPQLRLMASIEQINSHLPHPLHLLVIS